MRLKFDEKNIGWAIMLVLLIASILSIFFLLFVSISRILLLNGLIILFFNCRSKSLGLFLIFFISCINLSNVS